MPLTPEQQREVDEARGATHATRRATVPALEAILYEPLPVLDHGFVRVVDYMGDDSAIVQAELSLIPLPEHVVGLGIPCKDEASALRLVIAIRESTLKARKSSAVRAAKSTGIPLFVRWEVMSAGVGWTASKSSRSCK